MMRKLIYTVALVVMGLTASYAQQPGRHRKSNETPEQRAEKQASLLQQKLGLNADQKQKIQALELDRIRKAETWRKGDEGDRKAKMEERKAFMKSSKDQMDAILTADQKAKLEALRSDMRSKMKDRKGHRGPRGERAQTQPAPQKG